MLTPRAILRLSIAGLAAVTLSNVAHSRTVHRDANTRIESVRASRVSLDVRTNLNALRATAADDTTVLAYYDFEGGIGGNPQGWVIVDLTAQPGDFWHVDDFAGLGGGTFGRLLALEGLQSMWCGARPSTDYTLCGYQALPGYGNSWEQGFCTSACLNIIGDVTIDYMIAWDSEPGYDYTYLQYDLCDDVWLWDASLGRHDDIGNATESRTIPAAWHTGQVRVRFWFDSDGAWSDQDGLWDTDGGVIIDSLTVSDTGGIVLPTELFEVESPGDNTTVSGNWQSCVTPGYGDFTALFPGNDVLQEDPCVSNLSHFWGFFNGSTYNYACEGHPLQLVVPYENARGQYFNNEIWSPWIPITGAGSTFEFSFDMYRDMKLDALVFFDWHVRTLVSNCPTAWEDRSSVGGFGDQKDWVRMNQFVGDFILDDPGATHVQLALGARDMCRVWCGTLGTGQCHSHSPLFDNVELRRIDTDGPMWWTRTIDFFQDSFPADGTITGTVRADAAVDLLPAANPNIRLGDSTSVAVYDMDNGLAADPYSGFGSAVYLYVGVWPQGQPGKAGGALTQDSFRWPVVDSLNNGGDTWYCLRMDTSFVDSANRNGNTPDGFCVDLNDNLFTPGDTVCFFFCAESATGSRTYFSEFTDRTHNLADVLNWPMEFTCLPGNHGGDVLYVDAYDGLGAQPYFDDAFRAASIGHLVDRFDIRGSDSSFGIGLAARVADPFAQLMGPYRKIIWSSGDIANWTIGDGDNQKTDDAGLLALFLDNLPNTGGVWLSGDNIASDLNDSAEPGVAALRTYIGYTLINADHNNLTLGTSPLVTGVPNGVFSDFIDADTLIAFGGCPGINTFDVIAPAGTAAQEGTYRGGGSSGGATVAQLTVNSAAFTVGALLDGYGFENIRDDVVANPYDRAEHLGRIMVWMNNPVFPIPVPPSRDANTLSQNYPNPFNPATTIEFSVKDAGPVTLRVYNVVGQLVRTLVDENRSAGVVHQVKWDGRNDAGVSVASGVYFYRLIAPSFSQTRKMVMLK